MTRATIARTKPAQESAAPAAALLAWYDRHRRHLPWRALPGEPVDPYRVWLSEIMLQQTTVKAVAPYFAAFLARWPTVADLAAAPVEEVMKAWAGLGYYSRARNLHACAIAVARDHDGRFPAEIAGLRALPGVGDYTAAAVGAIAFDLAAPVVDGNVERVVTRLEAVDEPLPGAKPLIRALVADMLDPTRPGDFAQAMMDLGATICTPRRPACALCSLRPFCAAAAEGSQEAYPKKAPKKTGTLRRGAAFVVVRADGALLVGTRPPKGLLGGMTEVPGTAWSADFDEAAALAAAPLPLALHRLPGTVGHVFTHFPLELTVFRADAPSGTPPAPGMRWIAAGEIAGEAFPTVMRKVLAHAGVGPDGRA
ncbi:A/G-specific adenine glycosylase [Phreatobacter cathodiphilus]|uniref:Adenine DNA glycosylase n=1 Tax=Phreatobacter cathodiphilus TaxID=1868589 RepID=A0A2S0NFI6_9HYPH|nr:A/G-specific adenine glycosylase [Phreatobacter cathodiphilus]AVO46908.1 A/G-specific adenine glycosylase [Phreatobacter cathodiphilus]